MRFNQFLVGGITFSLLISFQLKAQDDWTIGEKEHYALLTDTHNNASESEEALEWLINHNPRLHENVYIAGVKVYKDLLESHQEPSKKELYYDELINLYDLRMKHFGRDRDVIIRKVTDAYLVGKDLPSKHRFKLELFDSSFNELDSSLPVNLLAAYMDVAKNAFSSKLIDQDGLIMRYFRIGEAFDHQGGKADEVRKYQAIVDKIFLNAVDLTCTDIPNIFAKDLNKEVPDISRMKLIVKMSIDLSCTNTDHFNQALSIVYENEPTLKIAEFLAKRAEADKEYAKAEKLYKDMISLAETDMQKSEVLLDMAKYYYRRGDKNNSRIQARKALALVSENKNAYDLLGDLYFHSYQQCKQEKSRVEDRCVFLLAYEYYQKAGNKEMMKESMAQFPSMESIHQETYSEGEEITCGCWINEKTTIHRRKED